MSDLPSGSDSQKPLGLSLLLCAVLAFLVFWLRLVLFRNSSVGVGYSLPIVIVGWTRRRNLVWIMCAVFAAMATTKFFLNFHVSELPLHQRIFSMLLLMIDLLILAAIIDLVIRREAALRSSTHELYRREQELKMSNEGLLERQETMEILLKLSRSLTVGQNREGILNSIAETITLLLGGTTAVALWERQGEMVEMIGHHGFGKNGPDTVTTDRAGSFAGLVMQQQHALAIPHISQRPDLKSERNRNGITYQAMLGAALKSGADVVGALVVYSPQARSWTESDQSLIESLAAQASVSIAATRLLEQTENEHHELQTIVDAVPFGILRTNAAANRLICNPAAAAMLGFPEIIEADSANWPRMKLVGPNGEIPSGRDPLLRALHGEVTAVMELELQLPAGDSMTMLCNAAPIRDRSGSISGAISAFVDVSVLKSLREEVVSRRRISDEAAARKSRFMSMISHEVRTPANAIGLLAELVRKTAATPAQIDEIPELCREIEQSSLGLVSLVTDALDLIRLDLARPELVETEIELGKWMQEQCKQLELPAKKKNLKFICDSSELEIHLRIDKGRLSRVLNLLVSNAARFTESGEVRVETTLLADRGLRFDVTDTGIGIPAEEMKTLFDELVQLKSPLRTKFGGTGLTLAIAQRLVELLGANLEVASEPGKGSTFSFILPSSKVTA